MDSDDARTWRPCDPAESVLIDLARVCPPAGVGWGREVPMRVRAFGLTQSGVVPGVLLARIQGQTGNWFGLVALTFVSPNGRLQVPVLQLASATCIVPAPEGGRSSSS